VTWRRGDVVVRRELLRGEPWCAFPTYVVADTDDLLATYVPTGAEIALADAHPWQQRGVRRWQGHGKLLLHRPGDAYSVDVFWDGPDRVCRGWYVNLQDPYVRHDGGFDTLDHELDLLVGLGGTTVVVKDEEAWRERVRTGFYTAEQAALTRATADAVTAMVAAGETWWDPAWAGWQPPVEWGPTDLPGPP
jgi:hypothetical protein